MASLLGAALRPRNDAPVPYVGRRASSAFFGSSGPSSSNQLARMSQVGTLFAIVNRTSTATAAPDWALYRKPADGKPASDADRQVVARHAAVDLWNSPNPFYTQSQLVEAVQQHIDLAGEGFLLVARAGKIPIELWPVRPDRMTPRTDPTKYLLGWTYRTPDGDKIDLDHDEVIQIKMPNPEDPFRGLSPVTAMIAELDSAQAATEWSSNFFRNSAQPGGIIEVPEALSDEEFDSLREHWAEQHQGVSNAHRVAIIEHGTWKTTTFSPRDLDFSALRNLGRDAIMEAYGISRATLGITDGVNYAAAKAAAAQFASLVAVPRLERWKQALNARLLPMFGATGKGVEFGYESPAESDPDEENAERTSRVGAVVQLLSIPTVKFDPKATLEAFGLPDLPYEDVEPPAPVIAPPQPPGQDPNQPPEQDTQPDPAQDKQSQPANRVRAEADQAEPWPGSEQERAVADYHAQQVAAATTTAIAGATVADAWLASDQATRARDLAAQGQPAEQPAQDWAHDIAAAVTATVVLAVLAAAVEGYLVGALAADALLAGESAVDWQGWTPGNPDTARRILDARGVAPKLNAVLGDADARTRTATGAHMRRFAELLTDAAVNGADPAQLAADLDAFAADPGWSYVVAQGESTAAAGQSAIDTYRAAGVRQIRWLMDERLNHCKVCPANEHYGPVVTGATFPSGHTRPPVHPRCGCFLSPVRVTAEESP